MEAQKSTAEKQGYQQSGADQQKTDQQTGIVNANLDQYNGPVQNTPYYKSLLQAGTTSTNQAYDNATRNLKASMEGAGVSGASGAAAGTVAGAGAQRAGALGKVGTDATQAASEMQMRANAQRLQEAGMYSGAGLGYFSVASQAEKNRLNSQGSLFNSLLQAGAGLGEAYMLA